MNWNTIKKLRHVGIFTVIISAGVVAISLSAIQGRAWVVTIDRNLTVTPSEISYETVFPEEVLFRPLRIMLSQQFLSDVRYDDVEYHIVQKIKPHIAADAIYCQSNPTDYSRCYPSLCPYLSKTPDGTPANDTGVPAFHNPTATTSIAYGRVAKSDNDISDEWIIDLHAPCFRGQCAQDYVVPSSYELDPALEHQVFGCDLKIVVDRVSYRSEKEGTIGFWKNWNKHKTYTQSEINGWLSTINSASGWIMSEAGYPANTTGMVNLINASNSCNGNLRSCAKLKFSAQYMASHLNVLSGRKQLGFMYNLTSQQRTYLGLTSPATLSDIFAATEGKLPDNGTNPTRTQFLIMQSTFDTINNMNF